MASWIRENDLGTTIADVRPLAGGTQNRVLRLRVDDRDLVLRCPPLHPRPSSNKTMLRESAVLSSLADTDVPHPRLVATCEDLEVLGMVFYLMEEVDGFNPGEEISDAYTADRDTRHESGLAVARALAHLGEVDPAGTPMAKFQRPGSFLSRQVDQWQKQLNGYSADSTYKPALPDVDLTAEWLRANQPDNQPPGIMHGDFHLNNVLLARNSPEVAAIVDWEMCTVGDPLLDLGWLLACWPHEPAPVATGARLASAGGLPTRTELVTAYSAASTRSVSEIDWYTALAGYKLGIVLEGTWARALAGKAPREVGLRLHECAIGLLEISARIASGDWSVAAEQV
ncbi:putative aminoglycoside phosphotransferase [Rhodococcus sp. B50]|nr:putative aminoglycoside phosphotransferase [Rhodococcus sp. B50]